jgi:spermidine synthase
MKSGERAILQVVIATGIASVVTQLLTIREFLSQFFGNEFVIALILFGWLILGGIGTLLARVLGRWRWIATAEGLSRLSLVLVGLSVVQLFAIRLLRDMIFIHGSSVGFYSTFAYIFCTILPYTLVLGFVLPYSLFVLRRQINAYPGVRIYITDNLGDIAGGALFAFVLVYLVTPLTALFIANLPLLVAAWLLFPASQRLRPAVLLSAAAALTLLLAGIYWEAASLTPCEGDLVHYRESRYGRIEVHRNREQFTLVVDGTPLFSNLNMAEAEETIHYPLAQIPNPRRILLISAKSGIMAQLKKYQPKQIDYVELDPKITAALLQFDLIQSIPKLNLIHEDGRAFIRRRAADSQSSRYDAVIINLSDPTTFQLNRFFTDRFFALTKKVLAPDGILSFSMPGFDNYLSEPQRQQLSSLRNTVADHFQNVLLLPGSDIIFLCRDAPLHTDIPARLAQKGILTQYISRYFQGNLTEERIRQLNQLMDGTTPKNHDYFPYLIRLVFVQWFAKFGASPLGFILVLLAAVSIYLFLITREEFVLFSTGCLTMGSEALVIFTFQIIYGYIYLKIGMIITIFLAGLLPGAWLGARLQQNGKRTLVFSDILLIVLMGIFAAAITLGRGNLPEFFFLLFGFGISLICGCQFPVALALKGDDNPAAARMFSADLLGAAFGTLIVSIVLIPYLGILWATAGLMALKAVSLVVTGTYHEKHQPATIS